MFTDVLGEFRSDSLLAGEAETTIDFYVNLLHMIGAENPYEAEPIFLVFTLC